MALLVLLRLLSGDCARLSFGGPPVDPDAGLSHVERMRLILEDYPARRDEVWDLRLDPILQVTKEVLTSPDPGKRLVPAILARGQTGWPVESELVQNRLNDSDRDVKLAAIRSLGQTGDPSSLPLLQAFLQDEDRDLRRAAIIALGGFADESLPPQLDSAAGVDPELREAARQSRRKIEALLAKQPAGVVEAWIETEQYEDMMPGLRSIQQDLLRIMADRERSLNARLHATRLLVFGKVTSAPRRFAVILADPSEPLELRVLAAFGIGRGRFRPGVPLLIETLDEEDKSLQEAAITALGEIGAAVAMDPLVAHWNMNGGVERDRIRLALARICSLPGRDELTRALHASEALPIQSVYFIDDELNLYDSNQPALLATQMESDNAEARRDAILILAFIGTSADAAVLERISRTETDVVNRELALLAWQKLSAPPGGR